MADSFLEECGPQCRAQVGPNLAPKMARKLTMLRLPLSARGESPFKAVAIILANALYNIVAPAIPCRV